MNWRKGLMRFWTLLSLAWIATVLYTEEPITKLHKPIRLTGLGQEHEFPADVTADEIRKALTQYFSDNGLKPQGKTPADAADELARSAPTFSAWHRLQPIVIKALLPPSLLLAIGLSLAWVLAGFRTKPA